MESINFLFFDTETWGLSKKFGKPYYEDLDNYPRIASISWILCKQNGERLSEGDFIVIPENFKPDKDSIEIHGISEELAKENGRPLKDVLMDFVMDFQQVDKTILVAHNMEFDFNVVFSELARTFPKATFPKNVVSIDTMKPLSRYIGIKNYHGFKWPSLQEMHLKLFGKKFDGAHNSKADTEALLACFFKVMEDKKGKIILMSQIEPNVLLT
jgi:DNA polymerase III alpha subunit (gram-positive type)